MKLLTVFIRPKKPLVNYRSVQFQLMRLSVKCQPVNLNYLSVQFQVILSDELSVSPVSISNNGSDCELSACPVSVTELSVNPVSVNAFVF